MPHWASRAPGLWFIVMYLLIVGMALHEPLLELAAELDHAGQRVWTSFLLPPSFTIKPDYRSALLIAVCCAVALWWTGWRVAGQRRLFRFAVVALVVTGAAIAGAMAVFYFWSSDELPGYAIEEYLAWWVSSATLFGLFLGVLTGAYVALVPGGLPVARGGVAARRTRATQAWARGAGPVVSVAGWPRRAAESEATRLLCGAAYLDDGFARAVATGLLVRQVGAVAPSPGVDLALVLRHCLTALRLRRMLQARLSAALLATALLAFASPWFLLLGVLVGAGIAVHDAAAMRKRVFTRLGRAGFAADHGAPMPAPDWTEPRLEAIEEAQRGNVTVFSGFTPFVGFGRAEAGWAFALPVHPDPDPLGGGTGGIRPFTVAELTAHVRGRLAEAAERAETTGDALPLTGLHLEERVFADGTSLTDHPDLLPHREMPPAQHLDQDEVDALAAAPDGSVRPYLCAHLPSWGGLVVASTFLRFSARGGMLYVECDRATLTPIGSNLLVRERSTLDQELGEVVREIRSAIARAPGQLLASPFLLLGDLLLRSRCERMADVEAKAAREDLRYDYGASFSVREYAAATGFFTQFQRDDAERALKLVERHVLEAMIEFLEGRGVDTADLRNRQTTILNEGVIQTGGTSNVGALAVGAKATATQQGAPTGKSTT